MSGFSVRRTHADDLSAALAAELHRHRRAELAGSATALMTAYRAGDPASSPRLDTDAATLAYAAYRMPATHAAVAAALGAAASPTLRPRSMLDLGGGTGAAVWAAAATFPTLATATVLDRSGPALQLGRRLAAHAATGPAGAATWTRATLTPRTPLPRADLVTMAYVLAELPGATAAALVTAAARATGLVAVIEPGTPAGYRRVLAARERLLAEGMRVLAPCPHEAACPLTRGDWCHFAARLDRSPLHRRIKGGSRSFEDEKFAYVVTARAVPTARAGRVVRRPLHRPGVVRLEVCRPDGGVDRTLVSRRQGPAYRIARDLRWGDTWAG